MSGSLTSRQPSPLIESSGCNYASACVPSIAAVDLAPTIALKSADGATTLAAIAEGLTPQESPHPVAKANGAKRTLEALKHLKL